MSFRWKSKPFQDIIKGKITNITGHYACNEEQIQFLFTLIKISEGIKTEFNSDQHSIHILR